MKKFSKYAVIGFVWLLVCFLIGICVGGLISGRPFTEVMLLAKANVLTFIIVVVVFAIASYPVVVLSSALHEFGHFLFGKWSGYRFVSFRVVNLVLLREDGKWRVKRFPIPGTMGQCLMVPPERPIAQIPDAWYLLGGVLMNLLLVATAAAGLCGIDTSTDVDKMVLKPILISRTLLINAFLLLLNGIPMRVGGIANDALNAVSLRKQLQEKRAFVLLLRINAAMQSGTRLKDMPREWFADIDVASTEGFLIGNLALYKVALLYDLCQFPEALELMETLRGSCNMAGVLKNEMDCELVFLYLVTGKKEQAMELWNNKQLRRNAELMKVSSTSKWRLLWALAKYHDADETKAKEIFTHIQTHAHRYLMIAEVKSDIAIINALT